MLSGPRRTVTRARKLRREMSLPEIILWYQLRQRPDGFKFRHQHPAGAYSLDFYCDAARLCIEVDGEAHERGDNPARDAVRDAWVLQRGVETMRIAARDVLGNLEGVMIAIVERAKERSPNPSLEGWRRSRGCR